MGSTTHPGRLHCSTCQSSKNYYICHGESQKQDIHFQQKFEKDLQSGKDISLENYQEEEKDYTTKTSKMSLKVSSKLENIISYSIKFIFRKLGSAIE